MTRLRYPHLTGMLFLFVLTARPCDGQGGESIAPVTAATYDDLVALFSDWRAFQAPVIVEGVPDYTADAMAAQHGDLAEYRSRLDAIDRSDWSVSERVDYELVRAEMNGLDFDQRVRRPWARDPAFYTMIFPYPTDVPAREGPVIHGAIELWRYTFPLSDQDAVKLASELRVIPPLLDQARLNLVGDARDLWFAGIRNMSSQVVNLETLAERVSGDGAELQRAVLDAIAATSAFVQWLREQAPSKNGLSGLSVDDYNWWLRNVHLVPYTWDELVTLMNRELVRAHASLRLEENRNRDLPELEPVDTAHEHTVRFNAAVGDYLSFLKEEEVLSVRDYMEEALVARIGTFNPAGPPHFFSEVDYREPLTMRTHHFHWFDLARMERDPHRSPIRRVPLLYNIYDSRAEGLATGMEEMMMHAGLFDDKPRARELIWILLAQRAARALGELRMHSNEFTMQKAIEFSSAWTPRGWLRPDGDLVWREQHLYLRQPGYGISYVIGKIQIEQLLGERAMQLGEDFNLRQFMDELDAAGVIPVSLIRWEMTGESELFGR